MNPVRILIILSALWTTGAAQDTLNRRKPFAGDLDLHLALQGGYIAAHREQMKHLQQGHSIGGFIQLVRPTRGQKPWHALYNFPETGIDLFFNYTGNARQLGNQIGACYIANLTMNRKTRPKGTFRHVLLIGIGPGYTTRIWDLESNRQADVLGSHINAALLLGWTAEVVRTNKVSIRSGVRITHYSNGAFQLPNLGTNNVALFLQAGWLRQRDSFRNTETASTDSLRRWTVQLAVTGGIQEVPPLTYPKQGVGVVSAWIQRRHSWKASFSGGIDLFYKHALRRQFENRDGTPPVFTDQVQAGLMVGYNLHFNRLCFAMQQGVYVRDAWKDNGLLYHRFGLRYEVSSHWFLHLMLKTHFAKADHSEFGFGYTL